jgi:ubiquinone/menaquinone biosynthesis C-methylase UbiE
MTLLSTRIRRIAKTLLTTGSPKAGSPDVQDLGLYWDPAMAAMLETWGLGNTWEEIELLLANCSGRVIDIACGTGTVMSRLSKFERLEVHGFDISDFLISKAMEKGIDRNRLKVMDATKVGYVSNEFDFGYSIGSLEHFTEEGIISFISEAHRITSSASFHMIPVSRSGKDEGWMKTVQSFHNNSVGWWIERFRLAYPKVHVLNSVWNDRISVGKWFVCFK